MSKILLSGLLAASILSVPATAIAQASPDRGPLTIYIAPATDCPSAGFGRSKVKIAEFQAQKARRQAEREGRTVKVVNLTQTGGFIGKLRTSEGLPTDIAVYRPVC